MMKGQDKIYLIGIGKIRPEILEELQEPLEQRFKFKVKIGTPLPSPDYAYNAQRDQYLSDEILSRLVEAKFGEDAIRVLGIVSVDLYTPGLNFILGHAQLDGKFCLISIYRLSEEIYCRPLNRELFKERILKEAVHELGHTFGLRHCSDPKCVMHFSNCLADTDIKSPDFCSKHKKQLEKGIKNLYNK